MQPKVCVQREQMFPLSCGAASMLTAAYELGVEKIPPIGRREAPRGSKPAYYDSLREQRYLYERRDMNGPNVALGHLTPHPSQFTAIDIIGDCPLELTSQCEYALYYMSSGAHEKSVQKAIKQSNQKELDEAIEKERLSTGYVSPERRLQLTQIYGLMPSSGLAGSLEIHWRSQCNQIHAKYMKAITPLTASLAEMKQQRELTYGSNSEPSWLETSYCQREAELKAKLAQITAEYEAKIKALGDTQQTASYFNPYFLPTSLPHNLCMVANFLGLTARIDSNQALIDRLEKYFPGEYQQCVDRGMDIHIQHRRIPFTYDKYTLAPNQRALRLTLQGLEPHWILERPKGMQYNYMNPGNGKNFNHKTIALFSQKLIFLPLQIILTKP